METGSTSEPHSGWKWSATRLLALLAFASGFVGMLEYEQAANPNGDVDLWSLFYHTLQLFLPLICL